MDSKGAEKKAVESREGRQRRGTGVSQEGYKGGWKKPKGEDGEVVKHIRGGYVSPTTGQQGVLTRRKGS